MQQAVVSLHSVNKGRPLLIEVTNDNARWEKNWMKNSTELAQDRYAWAASIRDAASSIREAGSTRAE